MGKEVIAREVLTLKVHAHFRNLQLECPLGM